MTHNDKALVERLRDFVIAEDIDLAADRIEALSAENERLREAFKKPDAWLITDGETYWVTGFEPHPKGHPYCEIIPLYRAALEETK